MGNKKRLVSFSCLLTTLTFSGFLSGCASTSMVKELQMKVDQAMEQSRYATEIASKAEDKCKEQKVDAEEHYKAVQAAADRADRAAKRAESFADMAKDSADRADATAKKVQNMYDRLMAK